MTKIKNGFQDFRLEDLTGGMNTRDYPSEIENKQSINLENWNFKGNKLVSSAGIDRTYNSTFDSFIQGMTVDGEDVWHIEGASLYKNGDIEYPANSYILTVGNIDGEIFSMSIDGTDYTFQFGFYNNEELARTEFETRLIEIMPVLTHTVTYTGGGVYTIVRVDTQAIVFGKPNLVKQATISDWDTEAKLSVIIDGTTTTIDGATYPAVQDAWNYVISQLPVSTYYTDYIGGGVMAIARIDAAEAVITQTQFDRYTYSLRYQYNDTTYVSQYLDFIQSDIDGITTTYDKLTTSRTYKGYEQVYKLDGIETKSYSGINGTFNRDNTWVGVKFLNLTQPANSITVQFNVVVGENQAARLTDSAGTVLASGNLDAGGSITFSYALTENTSYRVEYFTGTYDAYALYWPVQDNNIFNVTGGSSNGADTISFWGVSSITINGNLFDESIYLNSSVISTDYLDYSYFYINRLDFGAMSINSFNRYTDPSRFPDDTFGTLVTTINHKASLTVETYVEVSVVVLDDGALNLNEDDFYDLTVSSYGILIVSKRGLNTVFIDTDGTVHTITIAAVGTPTVGTIYKGKIILAGYEGKDNIVFSKTEDPVAAGNEMLDFATYSAGAQSVSGGNKGEITGFIVGENGLYVYKEDEIWYTNSEKDTGTSFNFIFNKITSTGAVNQGSISEVEQEVFYFDYIGKAVRRLGYEKNLTTLRDVAISREIEDIFEAIPDNDEANDIRTKTLISTSYKYPNFEIHITTNTSPDFYLSGADENYKYKVPNKTLVYNVDNKSWTVRTDKDNLGILHAFKGYFGTSNGDIYKDGVGNTLELGDSESKEYVFIDDVDYKRIGELEVVGDVTGVGGTKNFEIAVLVDGVELEIGETATPLKRIETAEDGVKNRFRTKIDLYDDGRIFQFSLKHNGLGKVEIADVNVRIKPLKISQSDYY